VGLVVAVPAGVDPVALAVLLPAMETVRPRRLMATALRRLMAVAHRPRLMVTARPRRPMATARRLPIKASPSARPSPNFGRGAFCCP
jgi:hypothetical protein